MIPDPCMIWSVVSQCNDSPLAARNFYESDTLFKVDYNSFDVFEYTATVVGTKRPGTVRPITDLPEWDEQYSA